MSFCCKRIRTFSQCYKLEINDTKLWWDKRENLKIILVVKSGENFEKSNFPLKFVFGQLEKLPGNQI